MAFLLGNDCINLKKILLYKESAAVLFKLSGMYVNSSLKS